jgi:hydrogenase nickel incorporation protein HypB
LLINKIDLLPHVDFDVAGARAAAAAVNPALAMFEVSCKTGQGLEDFFQWLSRRIEAYNAGTA